MGGGGRVRGCPWSSNRNSVALESIKIKADIVQRGRLEWKCLLSLSQRACLCEATTFIALGGDRVCE